MCKWIRTVCFILGKGETMIKDKYNETSWSGITSKDAFQFQLGTYLRMKLDKTAIQANQGKMFTCKEEPMIFLNY